MINKQSCNGVNILICLFLLLNSWQCVAQETKQPLHLSLGVGGIHAPKFTGSDNYETRVIPVIFLQYGRFSLSGNTGISYDIVQNDTFKAGLSIGYLRGRDESDADYLNGMGSINGGADLGAYLRKDYGQWYVKANIKRDFSHDIGGITSSISAGKMYQPAKRFSLDTAITLRWINDDYAMAFFGVTEQQSNASGLPVTMLSSGLESTILSFTGLYYFNQRWALTSRLSISQLIGDAKVSPITQDVNPIVVMTALSYRF